MRRVRTTVVGVLAAIFSLTATVVPAAAAQHNPVIFVHGWMGSSSNWDAMIADFKADGYSDSELYAWDYDTAQSNKNTADEFITVVNDMLARTGASAVDVVSHSMGGLNTRWYLKFNNGTAKVDDWVSLGGPNHGTTSADACYTTSCYEMRIGSDFLSDLNAGDESPSGTVYGTWWSPCDETINPDESVVVDGAKNTKTACISHTGLLTDETVSRQVRDFVA